MKYHNRVSSLAALAWVAVGGLYCWGCNQSLSQTPPAAGWSNNLGPGTGGNGSDISASDASPVPQDSSCADSSNIDGSSADSSPHRDFTNVEMDALPPPAPVPVCSTMVSFAQTKVMFQLGPSGTILGSVTPDGLTAAWTVPGSFSPGGSQPPTVLVADRCSSDAEFGAPQTIDMGAFAIGQDKVALSPDRLRLVVLRADLQGFLELRRTDPSSAFGPPDEGDFTDINSSVSGTGDALGSPTIAPNDDSFVYTRAQTIQESRRTAVAHWPCGSPINIDQSQDSGKQLRPSALSKDLLTIFLWDDQKLVEVAVWRIYPTDPFESTVRIGAFPSAQPGSACKNLFYASTGSDGNIYLAQVNGSYSP